MKSPKDILLEKSANSANRINKDIAKMLNDINLRLAHVTNTVSKSMNLVDSNTDRQKILNVETRMRKGFEEMVVAQRELIRILK